MVQYVSVCVEMGPGVNMLFSTCSVDHVGDTQIDQPG